ncbi:MAG: hypothetical protein KAG26_00275 [Methylococcales bacterium]|nr:hypothetical protein [Methylococcales bacterium]
MRVVVLLSLLVFTQTSYAKVIPSLCLAKERVIFSCHATNKKIISICASADLNHNNGYLQYRFGIAAKKPELIYPSLLKHPKQHFLMGILKPETGSGAYIKFLRNGFSYTIFTLNTKKWAAEGVVVKELGAIVAYIKCKEGTQSQMGTHLFKQLKISSDPKTQNFKLP